MEFTEKLVNLMNENFNSQAQNVIAKDFQNYVERTNSFDRTNYIVLIEEELEKAERGESHFAPVTIRKYKKELARLKAEKEQLSNNDRYLSSKGLITITEIAKEYGMSGRELNKFLHDKGIIYKKGNKWFIYQRYANDGLVGYEIFMPEDREIRRTLKWTTKGEQFIRSLLEDESIVPVLERPSQMMIEEDTTEYDGVWFTASEIAWKLNLNPKQYAKHIGRIANDCKLKPIFTDHNRYCRKIVDEYGRESYEYTAQGAMIIEKKIMEEMEV